MEENEKVCCNCYFAYTGLKYAICMLHPSHIFISEEDPPPSMVMWERIDEDPSVHMCYSGRWWEHGKLTMKKNNLKERVP